MFSLVWLSKLYPVRESSIYQEHLGGGFKYVLFSPLFGEDFRFDEHIFQMGWNHQPDTTLTTLIKKTTRKTGQNSDMTMSFKCARKVKMMRIKRRGRGQDLFLGARFFMEGFRFPFSHVVWRCFSTFIYTSFRCQILIQPTLRAQIHEFCFCRLIPSLKMTSWKLCRRPKSWVPWHELPTTVGRKALGDVGDKLFDILCTLPITLSTSIKYSRNMHDFDSHVFLNFLCLPILWHGFC